MDGLSIKDFFAHECHRSRITKPGRARIEWCGWCQQILKQKDRCPVNAALTPSSAPSPQLGPSENTVNSEGQQRGD